MQPAEERPAVQVKFADTGKTVKRLAVISGAGGSMFEDAIAMGADCLLTGEANHHAAIDAMRLGLSLIAAGHYATEFPVSAAIAESCAPRCRSWKCGEHRENRDPYTYNKELPLGALRQHTGCGSQHPLRAKDCTRVLLAAAPTTPPFIRHWRRVVVA